MISRRVASLLSTCIVVMLLMSNASATDNNNDNEEDVIPGTNLRRTQKLKDVPGSNVDVLFIAIFGDDRNPADCDTFKHKGKEFDGALIADSQYIAAAEVGENIHIETLSLTTPTTRRELVQSEGGLRSTNQQQEKRKLQDDECEDCRYSPNCSACCLFYCNLSHCTGTGPSICSRRRNLNEIRYDDFEPEMRRLIATDSAKKMAQAYRRVLVEYQKSSRNKCFGGNPSDIRVHAEAYESGTTLESKYDTAYELSDGLVHDNILLDGGD